MNIITIIFFFLLLISHVLSLIPNSTEILEENDYFINDMTEEEFIETNSEPYNNFFNLEEGKNTYCELCKSGSDIFLNTLIQEYKWGYLHNFSTFACSLFLRKDICHAAVGRYGTILLENTFKRLFNREKICTSFFICKPTIEYESVEEYAKRILKTKNINKKIETNNNINKVSGENEFSFIQITDTHLQLDYQENKVINCNIPLCCRNTPEELGFKNNKNHKGEELKFSKKYGAAGKCDANIEIVKAFAKEAKKIKSKIDFILFTGDFSAHNVWEVSQEEIIDATKITVDEITKELGKDIPIYPAIGNHEKAPPDVFFGSETILLHGLGTIFKRYLTQEAYDTFSQFGYYTMMHKNTNLRIISLNCIICDSMNFNLIGDSFQVVKMFKWLENVLSEAEKNKERVYLLDHIPLRSSQQTSDCTFRLKILLERYQNIISGLISAHTHKDEINLIKEYSNPKKYSIINYIAPGLSTYKQNWPSYRIYYANNETKIINDYIQMRLNLDETNKNDKPIWYISYKASEFYNVTTMNDYNKIAKANVDEIYAKHFLTDNPGNEPEYTNKKVINTLKCYFENDNYKDMIKCKNADKGGMYYLHYALNIFYAYWPKI